MKTDPTAKQPAPKEIPRTKETIKTESPEREAEILRQFREELDEATTVDQTSIRTSLLGRHE